MSLLSHLYRGSLLSDESLLQARERYLPMQPAASPRAAFAQWTKRVALQHELVSARELAGLSEAELAALESEFLRAPFRQRTDALRLAIPSGALLCAVGALALLLHVNSFALPADPPVSVIEASGAAALLGGLILICLGVLGAFSMIALDASHGRVGLYVGVLNEQHPWLYNTRLVIRDGAAEEYRQRVLRERGPLRGVDYLMMREIAHAHETLELTKTARSVAQQVQRSDAKLDPVAEPRLIAIAPIGEELPPHRLNGTTAQVTSVRAIASAGSEANPPEANSRHVQPSKRIAS
jgi:hypothetical protein